MKYKSAALSAKNSRVVTFQRGGEKVSLVVVSVPRSFYRKMRACGAITDHNPPEVPVVRKPGTDLYVLDAEGNLKYKTDYAYPPYVAAMALRGTRITGLKLWQALSSDPNISWDAVVPAETAAPAEWQAFADALYKESCDFEDGEVDEIMKASEACDLVAADAETEKAAVADFLSPA